MGLLFEKQPEWCRERLEATKIKRFDKLSFIKKALVLFDPSEVYLRIDAAAVLNPFQRYNSIPIDLICPKPIEKVCACGCGKPLTGRQTVWASKECTRLPLAIQTIISGHSHLRSICQHIFTSNCVVCGVSEAESDCAHELDHKHPVKHGGGGGWLSNYEFKCKACHRDKTNKDFNFGKYNTITGEASPHDAPCL